MSGANIHVIDEFIARYRKEYDFYDQTARLVGQLVDQSVQAAGIRAIVTSRAKSVVRLEAKVRQRDHIKKYRSASDIFGDIVDLAGVRVALYFPAERERVGRIITDLFAIEGEPKIFPEKSSPIDPTKPPPTPKRFSGYWATHYRVRLRDTTLNDAQKRYAEALVEIQVASVLMHAWAEVEHDLVYKPFQGQLSVDEHAILDELNGLVLAGEISLERLQRAGENRVASQGRSFANHYELTAYLIEQASLRVAATPQEPLSDALLGRVDLLFAFLKAIGSTTPEALAPYIKSLSTDFEGRPLAEQIVDKLISEKEDRYKTYESLKSQLSYESVPRTPNATRAHAIGRFVSTWFKLERLLSNRLSKSGFPRHTLPTFRLLEQLKGLPSDTAHEIQYIRRFRNHLVHGIEEPSISTIDRHSEQLEKILRSLRKLWRRPKPTKR